MEAGDHGRRRTAEGEPPAAAEAGEKCPRCGSRDTKFCYYNNYNMSQPRHFCKSCRRYWTLGGSLRNVPVGGSSRKRLRPSPPSTLGAIRIGSPLPGFSPLADLVAASNSLPPLGRGAGAALRLDDALLSCRGGFGLGLGLGVGRGSGAAGEEMGFGLASSLLWQPTPPSLLDEANETWRLGSGGEGDCSFGTTGPAAGGWTDLAISSPADGGATPPAREVR